MLWLLVLHAALAAGMPVAARSMGRAAFAIGALAPGAALGWAAARYSEVVAGEQVTAAVSWAPRLGLDAPFRLDALALAMLLLIAGVGVLVLGFSYRYFDDLDARDPALGRTAGLLVAFAGAMAGLVLADNLLVLYVFWEITTVCSFLLIGGRGADAASRGAASQALLVTTGAGFAMLIGFLLLGEAAGTYRISALLADPPRGDLVPVAVVLVLVGAFAKSAQAPLHSWLPAAMAAPTPVSAYLHAAAMVKGGVYLVARLAPAFADVAAWRPLVVAVGLPTMVLGGWRALRQDDVKLLLAYGTVSQLGFLMVLFGAGTRTAALAGMGMLLAHGLFKSALFLTVGAISHTTGTQRASELAGLWRASPVLFGAATLAAASMAGLPPLLSFLGKEAAFAAFEPAGGPAGDWPYTVVLAGVVAGSMFTVAYTARFWWGAFGGTGPPPWAREPGAATGCPGPVLVGPVVALAAAGLAGGLLAGMVDALAAGYADSVAAVPGARAGAGSYHLALWHGITPALALSAITVAAGAGLYALRSRLDRVRLPVPDAEAAFRASLRGLDLASVQVTRRVQVGSVPAYLFVILTVLVAVPGVALLSPRLLPGTVRLWDTPVQGALGLLVLAGAAGTAVARRRFTAVLLLGAAGYGIGTLFLVHGAPDLALAQYLVETLLLVVFVLALRRLPARFVEARRRGPPARATVAVLAAAVGIFVSTFFVFATSVRQGPGPLAGYAGRAEEAGGTNLVALILVDFRALDTMGEVSVLAVAAGGVASLILVAWRGAGTEETREPPREVDPAVREAEERAAARALAPKDREARRERWRAAPYRPPLGPRSLLLEVSTRAVVPTTLVLSAYLLLAGHGRIGGGFAGGLVAGMAYVLRYVAGGRFALSTAAPVAPSAVIGSGLLVCALTGMAPWAAGGQAFQSAVLEATVPVLGHVKLATSIFFDVGIYVIVVGLVLEVLAALGAQIEERAEGGGEP